jgi:PilZ domain-containing protein
VERTRDRMEETPAIAPAPVSTDTGWRKIPLGDAAERELTEDAPQRRAEVRTPLSLRAQRTSIDAVRDPVTGELFYDIADDDETQNLSRRGLCIRCERPPEVGTRVLVQLRLPGEAPVDVVGLARWTRVIFVPGEHGARAAALVGLELLGGPPRALERYGRALGKIARNPALFDEESAVASPGDRR